MCKRSDTERGELPASTNLIASNFSSNVLLRICTVSVVSNFLGSLHILRRRSLTSLLSCLDAWLCLIDIKEISVHATHYDAVVDHSRLIVYLSPSEPSYCPVAEQKNVCHFLIQNLQSLTTDACHKLSQLPMISNDRIEALLNYVCKGTTFSARKQIFLS